MAPDAKGGDILGLVTASSRSIAQMMGRHVTPQADRAGAAEGIASIHPKVRWFLAGRGEPPPPQRRQPDDTEVLGKEAQKARSDPEQRAHPQIKVLERAPETSRVR